MERQNDQLSGWEVEIWTRLQELEDWLDALALRIGDRVLGPRRAEKIFGPHPQVA